jgi:hypothetical protein
LRPDRPHRPTLRLGGGDKFPIFSLLLRNPTFQFPKLQMVELWFQNLTRNIQNSKLPKFPKFPKCFVDSFQLQETSKHSGTSKFWHRSKSFRRKHPNPEAPSKFSNIQNLHRRNIQSQIAGAMFAGLLNPKSRLTKKFGRNSKS